MPDARRASSCRTMLMTVVLLSWLGPIVCSLAGADELTVVPFDFESKFDNGRYGRMVGDMFWSKLDKQGGFILPESMLDVRDWEARRKTMIGLDTPLAELRAYLRDDWQAEIAIWGRVERVAGTDTDVYDLSIRIADFRADPPRMIFERDVRTGTVSEIPHVHVKEALDRLFERSLGAEIAVSNKDADRRWREGPNLVKGDFEKGRDHPTGWDVLPRLVTRVERPDDADGKTKLNRVIRFELPEVVAANEGVLYYSEYFPVEAGATYRFQCRWRTTGSAVKVFIKCYDELPTRFRENAESAGGTERREVYRSQQNLKGPPREWNSHTEDFTPRHAQFTPRSGRVMLYAYWPAGYVEFDDVVVKLIRPAPRD